MVAVLWTWLLYIGAFVGGYMALRYLSARFVYKNTHQEIVDAINKEGVHWTIVDRLNEKMEANNIPNVNSDRSPEQIVEHDEAEKIRKLVKERIALAEKKGTRALVEKLYEATRSYPNWIKQPERPGVPSYVLDATQTISKVDKEIPDWLKRLERPPESMLIASSEESEGMGDDTVPDWLAKTKASKIEKQKAEKATYVEQIDQEIITLILIQGKLQFKIRENDKYSTMGSDSVLNQEIDVIWNAELVMSIHRTISTMYIEPQGLDISDTKFDRIDSYIPGTWEDVLVDFDKAIATYGKERYQKNNVASAANEALKKKFGL